MHILKHSFDNTSATLTSYIQDLSPEMQNVDIRPAVLILPGGAYQFCSDREAEPVALAFLHYGFNAFVLRYTVGTSITPEGMRGVFENALSEARAALSYIRENAAEFHIQPDRIAAVGFSAGGHLAAALGTVSDIRPDALILGYAAVTRETNEGLCMNAPVMVDSVNDDTPPSFLFTTQGDTIVPSENTLLFALALARRRIPYEVHTFLTGDHGLSLALNTTGVENTDVAQWLPMSVKFLQNLWSGRPLVPGDAGKDGTGIDMRIDMLLADSRTAALMDEYLPGIRSMLEQQPSASGMTLRKLSGFAGDMMPQEKLEALDEALKASQSK